MRWFTFISFATVLFACSGVVAGQTSKTDREQAGLKGRVSSIQTTTRDFVGDKTDGRPLEKREGDLVTYDEAGHELTRKPVSDFGEAMGKMSRSYDKTGFLSESSWVDPKGQLIEWNVYTYQNGGLVQTLTYGGSKQLVAKTTNLYDSQGLLKQESYYDAKRLVAKTIYKYDEKGRLSETAFFLANGKPAIASVGPCLGAHRLTYGYDQKGRRNAEKVFEENGTQKKSFGWTYDDAGNITKYSIESLYSTVEFVYRYEVDSTGNWTKRVAKGTSLEKGSTVFGGKPEPYIRTTVDTRLITYF